MKDCVKRTPQFIIHIKDAMNKSFSDEVKFTESLRYIHYKTPSFRTGFLCTSLLSVYMIMTFMVEQ